MDDEPEAHSAWIDGETQMREERQLLANTQASSGKDILTPCEDQKFASATLAKTD